MIDVYTERINGGWLVSAIIGGYRVKRQYYDYTEQEAIEMFREENTLNKSNCNCAEIYTCCDCGGNDCGCAYCWSCNACDDCLND